MSILTITAPTRATPAPKLKDTAAPEAASAPETIGTGAGRVQARVVRTLPGRVWLGRQGLLRPVMAELAVSGPSEFTAVEPTTGIHGVGDSAADAIVDLRLALREHLEVLEAADQLSADLADQLAFLRRHVADR